MKVLRVDHPDAGPVVEVVPHDRRIHAALKVFVVYYVIIVTSGHGINGTTITKWSTHYREFSLFEIVKAPLFHQIKLPRS